MVKNEKVEKSFSYSIKKIIQIYLKSGKKRIIYTSFFVLVSFLSMSLLFITWSTYQNELFNTNISSYSWYGDGLHSSFTVYEKNLDSSIPSNYIDRGINDVKNAISNVTSNAVTKASASLEIFLRGPNPIYEILADYKIKAFDLNTSRILSQSLVAGRMPKNDSEIIYYKAENLILNFSVNDTIELKPDLPDMPMRVFTITGIIDDLETTFQMHGFSKDLIWESARNEKYGYSTYTQSIGTFITTPNYLYNLINNFTDFYSTFVFLVDIKYEANSINYYELNSYLPGLKELQNGINLDFTDNVSFKMAVDLYDFINNFHMTQLLETTRLSAISIIIALLFLLAISELFSYKKQELSSIFNLMLRYGLDSKPIKLTILTEISIITSVGILGGTILGIFSGFIFTLILKWEVSLSSFLNSLATIQFLIIFFILSVIQFVLGIYSRQSIFKTVKNSQLSEIEIEGNTSFINKIFSFNEILFLFPGIILLAIGIPGLLYTNTILDIYSNPYIEFLKVLFVTLLFIGIVLISFALFYLLSRIFSYFFKIFGKFIWQKRKSFLTLSLKNISKDFRYYQKIILVIFFIGLGFIPGLTINSTINNHLQLNSILATGCSDLIIDDWNLNQTLRKEIDDLKEIESTTEIIFLEFTSIGNNNVRYLIKMLAINATEFVNVANINKLKKSNYSLDDILALNRNMTCLLDDNFVRNNRDVNLNKKFTCNNYWKSVDSNELDVIQSFDNFPSLLNVNNQILYQQINKIEQFRMVVNLQTYEKMMNDVYSIEITSSKQQLLLKINQNSETNKAKSQLSNLFNIVSFDSEDVKSTMIKKASVFSLQILSVILIFTIFLTILFGFIYGNNQYLKRIRNVESDFRLGATKNQIWIGFLIEIIVLATIPLIISVISGFLLVKIYPQFLNIDQSYITYNLWENWWVLFVAFIIGEIAICIGWLLGLIPQIKYYKLQKQE